MVVKNNIKLAVLLKEMISEEETAYHGTSHYFKCFRTAAVGLGTGAQAYGWGLYFGKDVDIAKGYAGVGTRAGQKQILFQGKTANELGMQYECDAFFGLPKGLSTAEEFIDYAENMIEVLKYDDADFEGKEDIIKDYERFIDIIGNMQVETEPMEYVYTVLLNKGKSPDQYEYLDWDDKNTPIRQVDRINKQADKEELDFQVEERESPQSIYNKIETYFSKSGSKNAPKDASLFLARAGIDGNTHSNGRVRIIFDEKNVEIVDVCRRSKMK
jgi:hypothetical protein